MAFKKNYRNKQKRKNFKKYSVVEKIEYHAKRSCSPGKFGLKIGDVSYCYSDGFVEAFTGRNNEDGIRFQFGKRSSNSYALGYKRGKVAAKKYFHETGKQPFNLAIDVKSKSY